MMQRRRKTDQLVPDAAGAAVSSPMPLDANGTASASLASQVAPQLPLSPPTSAGRLSAWLSAWPLVWQAATVGLIGALAAATVASWVTVAVSPAWVALLAGLWVAAIAAWWARRSAAAFEALAQSARALSRQGAADLDNLPLLQTSTEAHHASQRLRRMVELAREQRASLAASNTLLGRELDDRTHELSTLQDLSVGLAGTADQFQLLDEALRALERTLDYSSASVWARDRRTADHQVVLMAYRSTEIDPQDSAAQSLRGMRLSRGNLDRYEQIEREQAPVIDNDARQSLLSWLWAMVTDDAATSRLYRTTRSWMAIPMKFRDHVMGVLRVDHQVPGYFTAERERLLSAVCSQAALAMRHAQLLAQERDVAVVAERNRIARDLHDAVSQMLFASTVVAGTLARVAQRESPMADGEVAKQALALEKLNRGALAEMRLLMFELRPDAIEQLPMPQLLRQAVEALECRGQTHVEAILAEQDPLPSAVRVQVWRVAQEAISNVGRHSGATQAVVEWKVKGQQCSLRVADDGCGFDAQADAPPGHFGLENMRARAAEIGALLTVRTAPGEGTEILLNIEVNKP